MRLANKVAIVTGGGTGIGAATAERFVKEGARVLIADFDEAAAQKTAAQIGKAAIAVRCDVRVSAECKAMADRAKAEFGRIDILINNAGRGMLGTVVTTDEKDWDDLMAVNVRGVFLCSKHTIPIMAAGGGGTIVNVASTAAIAGIPDRAAYVASKGAVAALTRSMALDHAAEKVRVNAVQPGVTWSNYYDRMLTQVPDAEAFKKGLRDRSPLGRWGEPSEIAGAILYLASDESGFATGSMLTIDGGYTAR